MKVETLAIVALLVFMVAFAAAYEMSKPGGVAAAETGAVRTVVRTHPIEKHPEAVCDSRREPELPSVAPYMHDPGQDISGRPNDWPHRRTGLNLAEVVEGENQLRRFNIYSVIPSSVTLKYQKGCV